jgi:hypothetical protein
MKMVTGGERTNRAEPDYQIYATQVQGSVETPSDENNNELNR